MTTPSHFPGKLPGQQNQKQRPAKQVITGAEAVILSLIEAGVDTIFGYPGGAIMPVYDALYDYHDKINHVLVRHEQGASHAAQGYARVNKKTGVCLVTSGPGATNLVTGIADALIDSTPMVCISGQVPRHLLGSDAFQETDIIGITMPITKWSYQITEPEEIPWAIARAFYIANSGRPGPVMLDITKNAELGTLEYEYQPCTHIRSYIPVPETDPHALQQAAELINQAKKPYLLVGHGVLISEAQQQLRAFIEKTGIPFGWTIMGLSAMPNNHPLNTGMLGMHGNYGPNIKTNECDVLIAVGMRFDDRVTGNTDFYAKQAKIIHIEIDKAEIDKNIKVDVPLLGDAKAVLQKLLPLVEEKSYPEWLQEFRECERIEYEKIIHHDIHPSSEGLHMGEVIHLISEKTEGKAIIVPDVGQHQMAACRYYKFADTDGMVTSGGLGTMGFALPAAIGAKIAQPQREVIAIIGDGCFQMTIQELGVIAQNKLPVKMVILNNNFLGMVRQWQQLFFDKRYSFTELVNPDFVAITQGYGIPAKRVSTRDKLSDSIEEMLKSEGPFLLEVVVEKEANVFPMVPSGAAISDIRLE